MAAQKKLEAGSKYAGFDKDGDGVVTDEEFEMEQKLIQLENEDKKQDAQRNMAWFAPGEWIGRPHARLRSLIISLHASIQAIHSSSLRHSLNTEYD